MVDQGQQRCTSQRTPPVSRRRTVAVTTSAGSINACRSPSDGTQSKSAGTTCTSHGMAMGVCSGTGRHGSSTEGRQRQ